MVTVAAPFICSLAHIQTLRWSYANFFSLYYKTRRSLLPTIAPNLYLQKSNLDFIKYKLYLVKSNLYLILCSRLLAVLF